MIVYPVLSNDDYTDLAASVAELGSVLGELSSTRKALRSAPSFSDFYLQGERLAEFARLAISAGALANRVALRLDRGYHKLNSPAS